MTKKSAPPVSRIAARLRQGAERQMASSLPILAVLRSYDGATLRADALAGLSVALVSLPQAIGFALIAGLPPQMVVASLLVGGLVAALFSSSSHVVFGPTNTMSLFLAGVIHQTAGPLTAMQVAILVGFSIGVVQLAAGIARLGNLTQFISRSVILGYSAAAALLICVGQLPNLFGIVATGHQKLPGLFATTAERLADGRFSAVAGLMGLGALLLLLLLRRVRPHWPEGLVVLALATALAWGLDLREYGVRTVADLGALAATWPAFLGLPLNREALAVLPEIMNAALALSVLGMLEAISIAKNIGARTGQSVEPNQELVSMGAGNLMACAFGAMPGSASFVRSAVNHQSGGRTQFSAIFAALVVGVGLFTLVPLANQIPVAAVAAILLVVAAQTVNWQHIRTVCRSTRSDMVVFAATFAGAVLLNLDTAIYLGIGVSLALFLQKAASPALVEYAFNAEGQLAAVDHPAARKNPQVSIVHVEGDLFFGASDLLHDHIRQIARDQRLRVVILRMKNARHLDGSTVLAIEQLADHLRKSDRHLLISGIHGDVARVLKRSGLVARLGEANVFAAEENPTLATKKALVRAQHLIGVKVDVRLFYPPEQLPAASA